MLPFYIPILILITMFLLLISKENINYIKYKILIFLIGFFTIIFSETTIRFVSNSLNENIAILIIPFF